MEEYYTARLDPHKPNGDKTKLFTVQAQYANLKDWVSDMETWIISFSLSTPPRIATGDKSYDIKKNMAKDRRVTGTIS